jgi:Zn finger protein HypA/HybF involved in hydrogenase expression
MAAELKGPIELEASCECGEDIVVSDEQDTVCPNCGRTYRLIISLSELM